MDKEKQANENSEMSPEKKQKIMEARERATEEKEKVTADVYTLHCPAPAQEGWGRSIHSSFRFTSPDSPHATDTNM